MVEELRLLKEANQAQIELQKQQFAELLRSRTQLCISCRSDFSNAATANVDESSTTKNDSPSSTEDSTLVVEKIWTEEDWLHQLRSAVWSLAALSSASVGDSKIVAVADCADGSVESLLGSAQQYLATYATASATPDTSSATVTAVAAAEVGAGSNTDLSPACELLVMYLTNILKNPSVPRYRRIATTNSSYMKSLLPVELHAAQLLAAVGFVKKAESTYFEYTWHNLPPAGEASKSNSSSTTSGGTSSSGKGADRAPESAQAATRLLQAAVALLAALKISRRALADLLVQQLTSIGAAAASVSATSADAAKSTDVGEPSAMVHASALPIMNVVPAVASNAAPAIGGGDDGLIAVMEVAGEEGLQAGGSVQDDSVDFMKVHNAL